ncbi:hypothetical protein HLRTI_001508 [Halorhabdus tiamatea SARL4B]|uniref:Uncharacterized protein n=1 Tax=Halorhabdus tiamatea SARL4B TaxID=1033806 RepID=F7PFK8_9EURY|nr:hypothetical protein [Halorhabdus tiamatea]ERJ06429.1 hypothetical protein HLRTI_001508 [Halorhabdus tiamatea SARL4B]CCQ34332.1 hypothetical protein HTIA_2220 [Halorhabdus tiamatea SARL4B]
MIDSLVIGLAYALAFVALIEVSKRYLPAPVLRRLAVVKRAYLAPFRWLTPDRVYRLWYETGVMDAESYRWFQQQGYIGDDLDPAYIQRTHSADGENHHDAGGDER